MSHAFFDFLMIFGVSFVNLSLEMLHTLLLPLFLGPVFLICSKTCTVVFCKEFLMGVSVKMAVVLFFLLAFRLFLGLALGTD